MADVLQLEERRHCSTRAPVQGEAESADPLQHDVEFFDPPAEVQTECSICLEILSDPHLVECCGHSFCAECIGRVQKDGKPCPLCNEPFKTMAHKALKRTLNGLKVYCVHRRRGCEWVGERGKLDRHLNLAPADRGRQLDGCQFVVVECLHCGQGIRRDKVRSHQDQRCPQRPYTCEFCGEYASTFEDVAHNHYQACIRFPLPCPNGCSESGIEREELANHMQERCPLAVVPCPFSYAGCEEKLPRQALADHLAGCHMPQLSPGHRQEEEVTKNTIADLPIDHEVPLAYSKTKLMIACAIIVILLVLFYCVYEKSTVQSNDSELAARVSALAQELNRTQELLLKRGQSITANIAAATWDESTMAKSATYQELLDKVSAVSQELNLTQQQQEKDKAMLQQMIQHQHQEIENIASEMRKQQEKNKAELMSKLRQQIYKSNSKYSSPLQQEGSDRNDDLQQQYQDTCLSKVAVMPLTNNEDSADVESCTTCEGMEGLASHNSDAVLLPSYTLNSYHVTERFLFSTNVNYTFFVDATPAWDNKTSPSSGFTFQLHTQWHVLELKRLLSPSADYETSGSHVSLTALFTSGRPVKLFSFFARVKCASCADMTEVPVMLALVPIPAYQPIPADDSHSQIRVHVSMASPSTFRSTVSFQVFNVGFRPQDNQSKPENDQQRNLGYRLVYRCLGIYNFEPQGMFDAVSGLLTAVGVEEEYHQLYSLNLSHASSTLHRFSLGWGQALLFNIVAMDTRLPSHPRLTAYSPTVVYGCDTALGGAPSCERPLVMKAVAVLAIATGLYLCFFSLHYPALFGISYILPTSYIVYSLLTAFISNIYIASLTSLATASAACIGMDWSLRSMYAHDGYVLVALLALSYISEFPVLATFVYMLGMSDGVLVVFGVLVFGPPLVGLCITILMMYSGVSENSFFILMTATLGSYSVIFGVSMTHIFASSSLSSVALRAFHIALSSGHTEAEWLCPLGAPDYTLYLLWLLLLLLGCAVQTWLTVRKHGWDKFKTKILFRAA